MDETASFGLRVTLGPAACVLIAFVIHKNPSDPARFRFEPVMELCELAKVWLNTWFMSAPPDTISDLEICSPHEVHLSSLIPTGAEFTSKNNRSGATGGARYAGAIFKTSCMEAPDIPRRALHIRNSAGSH